MIRSLTGFSFLLLSVLASAQEPKLVLPIGHTSDINSCEFSLDGKMLLTASNDKSARLWDTKTGALLNSFGGAREAIKTALLSPDGSRVVTIDENNIGRFWDTRSGEALIDSIAGSEQIYFAAFLPSGKELLIADGEIVRIISTGNSKELRNFSTGLGLSYAISLNGELLAIGYKTKIIIRKIQTGALVKEINTSERPGMQFYGQDKHILLWGPSTTAISRNIDKTDNSPNNIDIVFTRLGKTATYVFSSDRQQMAVLSDNNKVYLLDLPSGKILATISAEKFSRFKALQFMNSKQGLLTARESPAEVGQIIIEARKINPGGSTTILHTAKVSSLYTDIKHLEISANNRTVLIGASAPDDNYFIDLHSGRVINNLSGKGNGYYFADFNHRGDKIITASTKRPLIWNAQAGSPDSLLGNSICFQAEYSPDDSMILLVNGYSIQLRHINDPKRNRSLGSKNKNVLINKAFFSGNGERVLFYDNDNVAVVWQVSTGNLISYSRQFGKYERIGGISYDGKSIMVTSNDSLIFFDSDTWNMANVFSYKFKNDLFYSAQYTSDHKNILATSFRGHIKLIDAATGVVRDSIQCAGDYLRQVQISPDKNKLLVVTKDYQMILYDRSKKSSMVLNNEQRSDIRSIRFNDVGNNFITASSDFTFRLWNSETGSLLSTFFSVDSSDYFTFLPGGYYQTTPVASRLLHYVTKDLKVISFEQLDLKYNRPDKVMEALGNTDTALIRSYRRAWEKRIHKLGIDTSLFRNGYSVPEAEFANRDTISYEQKNKELKLHIIGKDSIYKLDRFNVWVNEVPIFGQRGINLRGTVRNEIDTFLTVFLSQGENRIETSIFNSNGTESYRIPLIVNNISGEKIKEKVFFVGLGVDKFERDIYDLQYSCKDIRDLTAKLKEKYGDALVVDTLFNEALTIKNLQAIKQRLLLTGINDKVIVSYSGHGILSKDFDYFLSTYHIKFEKPEENGLPYEQLEDLLDSIPARRKLMLIDACHSGEVDKEELVHLEAKADSLHLARGGITVAYNDGDPHLGMKNSFELMQSIFVNVGRSTGATIISAATGTQLALEKNNLKNGVFTYCILETLNKYPGMKISELRRIVSAMVEELTNGLQKPTSRNENIAVDWNL